MIFYVDRQGIFLFCRMTFKVDQRVEVMLPEEGFQNSYYEATVVSVSDDGVHVRFEELSTDDNEEVLLEQVMPPAAVRPYPPTLTDINIEIGDIVDVYDRGGWWKGILVDSDEGRDDGNIYQVYFSYLKPEEQYGWYPGWAIRLHQDVQVLDHGYSVGYLKRYVSFFCSRCIWVI